MTDLSGGSGGTEFSTANAETGDRARGVARAKDGRARGGQSRLLRRAEWLAVEAGWQGRR
jgi:hypothetical protein